MLLQSSDVSEVFFALPRNLYYSPPPPSSLYTQYHISYTLTTKDSQKWFIQDLKIEKSLKLKGNCFTYVDYV